MAYTPRFARKKERVSPLGILLVVIVALASMAVTGLLLRGMIGILGSAGSVSKTNLKEPAIMEKFDSQIGKAVSQGLQLCPAV